MALLTTALLALATSACAGGETPQSPATTALPSSSTATTPPTTSRTAPPTSSTAPPGTTRPTPPPPPTTPTTSKALLQPGDSGLKVRELQARLRQLGWFEGDVTDYYGTRTTTAVSGFQAKRGLPATGVLDERTWQRLVAMTHTPTIDDLNNVTPAPRPISWDVDSRCLTGFVICISKTTRELTVVRNGTAQYGMDVRFGSEMEPTREGVFHITWKKVDVVSNLYHTPMPYSMFFSGGQAIHYSYNFARLGYNGNSHGCVNVRDWDALVRLYNEAPVDTKVVIHW
jgi:peptidoglycan hydrolase-like protein with peptidoglycan-binding domain